MTSYRKKDYPVEDVRRFLEPGPVVLVSSAYKDDIDIMTMGWHTVMEFSPSLIGCVIASSNYSFDLIRKSKECVINLPTTDLTDEVIGIGNESGAETDKFTAFNLTPVDGKKVAAPLIDECYANFECKLHDASMVGKYNFFVFKVVKAHVATSPKFPETLHYRGQGIFTLSGETVNLQRKFKRKDI